MLDPVPLAHVGREVAHCDIQAALEKIKNMVLESAECRFTRHLVNTLIILCIFEN